MGIIKYRAVIRILLLILITFVTAHVSFGQIPDYSQNCPNYPCKMQLDTNSYIYVTGDILLGSGIITRDNSGSGAYSQWRTMDYRIPCNKPSVAISMAHAWQLYRNIFKVKNYNINTFSGILINETSGGACQPPGSLDFSCYPTSSFPFQNTYADFIADHGGGSGIAVSDGCYQIDGLGRLNLQEWYGTTECGIFSDLHRTETWITGNNIERNAIARVYYDLAFSRRVQYVMGVDPLPVISTTNDPLGWYKVVAVAYNRGPGMIIPTIANRIFVTNRALAISSNDWFDPLLLGPNGYAQACAHYVKILSNNYTPANAADQQKWTGWYDYNISWADMDSYMTTVFVMHGLTPAEELAIRNKVQAVFNVQKDASGKVSFKTRFGPVIDALVKALPYFEPTNTINNSQMGDAGCKGCVGPVVRIKANTPTKVCKGLSVELETVYGAGYTYYWLKDNVLVSNPNPQQHIFYASQAGVYDVVVKDNKGCAIRSDGAVNVTIDNTCSSCNLVANGTITANSCSGIKDGKIVIALSGPDYNPGHTYSYKWTLPTGAIITQSGNTLTNISEGAYQLTVTDLSNSTCKAYQTFKVVETTPFYQTMNLTQAVQSCSSSKLTATVIDNPPANCSYKVWIEGVPDGSGKCWGQTWSSTEWRLEIKTNAVSIGGNSVPVFTNGVCPSAQITFGANHGDVITINFNNISSTAVSGKFIYKLMDPKGNVISKNTNGMSFPGGSITNLITTTANCSQTTPAFSFTWSPLSGLSTPTNTSLTSNTTATVGADVQYIVEATTSTAPACKLRDSILVKYTCTPTCTPPTTIPTFVSTNVSVCSPATTASVTATLPANIYYQLFNSTTNAAVGTAAGPSAAGNVTINNVPAGSYHVRIASSAANLTAATCYKASTTPVVVTINSQPASPTTGTNPVVYCLNATAIPLTATGTSLQWYNVATLGTPLSGAPTPVTTAAGTTSYWVSQTVSGCESPRLKIDVTVNATPAPTTGTNPVVYCQNEPSVQLTASGTNLQWYTVATLGTALASAPIPSTSAAGTTSYWVSQTTGICESSRLKIDVTVNSQPAAPTTGSNPVVYCQHASATGLSVIGTNLKWYTTVSGGTASTSVPTPSTSATGTTPYWVSQTTGGCESPRLRIDVTVNSTPSAPGVVSPVSYCQNVTAVPLTASGTNLKWYTAASGGTSSSTAPTPATATVGTTSYWVSSTSGACESPRAQIDVVVSTSLATPTVSPVSYCQGASASALTAGGVSLLWYTNPTGGTGSPTAPVPATSSVGTVPYYVSQVSGTCESPRAQLDVTITAIPLAPGVSNPGAYCIGATAAPLSVAGSGLLWYSNATGGTGDVTAPTPATTTAGTVSYYVSQTVNGCESPRAQIDVTVNASPLAPTTTINPVVYCQNAAATALTANGTSLQWYTVMSGGTALGTAPTPSTAVAGSPVASYWVSQTISGCEGARLQIDVNVVSSLTAPTVSDKSYCEGETSSVLTAGGTNLLWYSNATGGTGDATAPTPATTTAGVTSYYVSQVSGTCESPRARIDITVNASPLAPTVTNPGPYCEGATINPLSATGSNLLWYSSSTGGTGSATIPTPSSVAGSESYWVSQTVAGCESARARIDVVINAIPSAPAVSNPSAYCEGGLAAQLTATGSNLLWYTVETGGIGNPAAPIPSTSSAGTLSYWVSQTVSGCESSRAKMDVTVNTTPAAPTVSSHQIVYCQNDVATALTAVGTLLKWYTTATGGTGDPTAPTPVTTAGGTTSYYVSLTLNGCEGERARIDVVVKPNPDKGLAVRGSEMCSGSATATATVIGSENGVTYEVYKGGTKIGTGDGNGADLPISIAAGTFTEGMNTVTFKAVGCGTVDMDNPADILVMGNPGTITGPADAFICNDANTGLIYSITTVTGAANYLWSIDNQGKVNGTATTTTSVPTVSVDLTSTNINKTTLIVSAVSVNGLKCQSSQTEIKQTEGYQAEDLLLSSDKICQGEEIAFTISNPNAESYVWDINTASQTVGTDAKDAITRRFEQAGSFEITLIPSHPCKAAGTIPSIVKSFTVVQRPVAVAGNDTIMSVYNTIELNGTGSSAGEYTWTSDDALASIVNPLSLLTKADFKNRSVVFTLTVSDPNGGAGCYDSDSRTVELDVKVNHLPNSFSPNGDGNHDTYEIPNINYYSSAMVYIYNQWGELIFKSEPGYTKSWDGKRNGKECEVGAYLMLIEFNQDGLPTMKETINLVR